MTEPLHLTGNALQVLQRRYLQKDAAGQTIETPEEMFRRVARAVSEAEDADVKDSWEKVFYDMMVKLEFLPNSPTLMNAGRPLGQLSACFVLPVYDDMTSIFDAVKYTALIHQSGGGTGFAFSHLRPELDRVGSTGGVASGPVSFMKVFDAATDVIKQGGMRRGANMAILQIDHPDILKFIEVKQDLTVLTNFNLSVAITDAFMQAVQDNTTYDLINPRTQEIAGKLQAREVFDKIVDSAWRTGEPGVVFIDEINRRHALRDFVRIESTNPCGEQPLLPYESCNLGSINLARMFDAHTHQLDKEKLLRTIHDAVRFLDNVISINHYPLPEIEKASRDTRKIGLGIMGFADLLIQMRIPYNSDDALNLGSEVMSFIQTEAYKASVELAKEHTAFPLIRKSIYTESIRNATRTTIAPTGTLSLIAGCSSGIEPLFALAYTRKILDGRTFVETNTYFEQYAREEGFYSDTLMQQLADGKSLQDIPGVPDYARKLFITAHDITPVWHVAMQAAFQAHTDNAVSKTVNFAEGATKANVAEVFKLAYEQHLKGITIYRDGSRKDQVLSTHRTEKIVTRRNRPKVTTGLTEYVNTGCGHLYVTLNYDEAGLCEVFSTLGRAGGCAASQLEAISRLISLGLQQGQSASDIVKQLRGVRCPSISWDDGASVLSCADAIAIVLDKYTSGHTGKIPDDHNNAKNVAGQCPECGELLVYQEGCLLCPGCGFTKC